MFLPMFRARVQAAERDGNPVLVEETPEAEERRIAQENHDGVRELQDRMALGEVADELGRAIFEPEERMRTDVR